MSIASKIGSVIGQVASPFATLASTVRRARTGLLPPTNRERFVRQIGAAGSALEIGPFYGPQLKGAGVSYFDVLDQAGLKERAQGLGFNADGCPKVDFVSPTGDMAIIDKSFEAVFSSHAIEHQPDFVAHLAAVERILLPGGRYHLIIPDKRYCMDHFTPETQLADICAAHLEARKLHTPAAVIRHHVHVTHNRAIKHWLGIHGSPPRASARQAVLQEAIKDCEKLAAGEYVDVHGWRFTPEGFANIMDGLNGLGWTKLGLEQVHDTKFGTQEFFAVLTKPKLS